MLTSSMLETEITPVQNDECTQNIVPSAKIRPLKTILKELSTYPLRRKATEVETLQASSTVRISM